MIYTDSCSYFAWGALKVEMILQALEYESGKSQSFIFSSLSCLLPSLTIHPKKSESTFDIVAEHGKVLDEFFISTAGRQPISFPLFLFTDLE